jgi:hypothetical protein
MAADEKKQHSTIAQPGVQQQSSIQSNGGVLPQTYQSPYAQEIASPLQQNLSKVMMVEKPVDDRRLHELEAAVERNIRQREEDGGTVEEEAPEEL